jgi:putative tryptophan/tyrosine transport system substrate-binding protein
MDRRGFVTGLAALFAGPLAATGQSPKLPRIGVLVPAKPPSPTEPHIAAFRQGLRALGYVEGQNVVVEYRYAHGKAEVHPELITQLIGLNVDVVVVGSGAATLTAKSVTQTIPIVGVSMGGDPVANGLVASLARPGGNITGVSGLVGGGFFGKRVELLKEAAPQITRVWALRDSHSPITPRFLPDLRAAADTLGLNLQVFQVRELSELDSAFAAMSKERSSGLIVSGEALFFPHRSRIPELAAKHKLPAIYEFPVFVEAGGLISYGYSLSDLWRRASIYVDKILKGAKPADLPVEQPTKFELVINLKTAKALGLTIPPSLLLRADQVIE